jgi:hypothetical protein
MSDPIEESGVEVSGQGVPTPASGSPSDSSNSQSVAPEDVLVEKILAKLEPRLRPMMQSVKDKRISDFEKRLNQLQDQTTKELVDSGLSEKEAKEAVSQYVQKPQPIAQTDNRPGTAVNVSELQRAVLSLAGLNESDPDVILLSNRNLPADAYASEVKAIVDRRKTPPPISTATQPVTISQTDLSAEYRRELSGIPQGDIHSLMNLKQKYREKGLSI